MPKPERKPLGEGDTYEDEVMRAFARLSDEDEAGFRCPTCRGRGLVNPLTAPPDFFCAGTTDCPHCDGTGEI